MEGGEFTGTKDPGVCKIWMEGIESLRFTGLRKAGSTLPFTTLSETIETTEAI